MAADIGYIRYFIAFIIQFQFYKVLCEVSGQYVKGDPDKPLHRCNFYGMLSCRENCYMKCISVVISGSKEAGDKLMTMLELGSSKPWKEVMEVMTGQPKVDTAAYREYFRPLEKWLKEENERNGVSVGWKAKDLKEVCTP